MHNAVKSGLGNWVFSSVLGDLGKSSLAEIEAADISQSDEIEENIGELLLQVLLVVRAPVRQPFGHFPFPLEYLRQLSHFSHLHTKKNPFRISSYNRNMHARKSRQMTYGGGHSFEHWATSYLLRLRGDF